MEKEGGKASQGEGGALESGKKGGGGRRKMAVLTLRLQEGGRRQINTEKVKKAAFGLAVFIRESRNVARGQRRMDCAILKWRGVYGWEAELIWGLRIQRVGRRSEWLEEGHTSRER